MRASVLAYKAAQEMSERGHCKKLSQDQEGRVCLYGALNCASGYESPSLLSSPAGMTFGAYTLTFEESFLKLETPERLAVISMVTSILRERGVPEWETPHLYNDREDVSGEDVVLLLKEAAARLEARENADLHR